MKTKTGSTSPITAAEPYPGLESEGTRSAREIMRSLPLAHPSASPAMSMFPALRIVNNRSQRAQLLAHLDRLEQTLLTDPPTLPHQPPSAAREPMEADPYLMRQ